MVQLKYNLCVTIAILCVQNNIDFARSEDAFIQTHARPNQDHASSKQSNDDKPAKHSLCCSFPCKHSGICYSKGFDAYICDCTGTNYFGSECQHPHLLHWLKNLFLPSQDQIQYFLTHFELFWAIVNIIPGLHQYLSSSLLIAYSRKIESPPRYESNHAYITMEPLLNSSYYVRSLPMVPDSCPTPLGTVGKKVLPAVDELANTVFKRFMFNPEPKGTNLLFMFYTQHILYQIFNTDYKMGPGFTQGSDWIDLNSIYGTDRKTQQMLRTFSKGNLKYQIISGEEYPPKLHDVPGIHMSYPTHIKLKHKFAMANKFSSMQPGVFVFTTIWLREHNQICEFLSQHHPEWNDEQLFQTARLILIGETLQITTVEYLQYVSQYNLRLTFTPESIWSSMIQFNNKVRVEHNILSRWFSMYPEFINISDSRYRLEDLMYNVEPVLHHGFTKFIETIAQIPIGEIRAHNHPEPLIPLLKSTLLDARELRLQSFNQYRRHFGLTPYITFLELTGSQELAEILQKLYGDIEALEFYVGLFVEARGYSILPPTMIAIGGAFMAKLLVANPVCSETFWRPASFGGTIGFERVKSTTLKSLICRNLKGDCPRIAFNVPTVKAKGYSTIFGMLEKIEL